MINNPFLDTKFCKDIKRSFIPKTMEMNDIDEICFRYDKHTKMYNISIRKDDNTHQYEYKKCKKRNRQKKNKVNHIESGYESNLDNIEYKTDDNIVIQDTIDKNQFIDLEQDNNEKILEQETLPNKEIQDDEVIQDTILNQFSKIDICKKFYGFMEEMCYNILNKNNIELIHEFAINTLSNVRDFWTDQGFDIN
jgi:hypothetical protein